MEDLMNRSLGAEKTVQTKQYHPLKFSTYVSNIPLGRWSDEAWLAELWRLLYAQTLHMFMVDIQLREEVGNLSTDVEKEEYLLELQREITERLDLTGLVINYSMDVEHPEDEREEI